MAKPKDPAGLGLRVAAAGRLRQVLADGRFQPLGTAELADSRDRAVANRLVTTALRRKGHIDLIVAELLERGLPAKSGNFEAILRVALSQLIYLPELGAHSAIFLAVEALKRDPKGQHLRGLLNAVLRRAQTNAARYWTLADDLLIPEGLRTAWQRDYGPEAVSRFAAELLAGAPLDLTLKDNDAELIAELAAAPIIADSVRVSARERSVEDLPGYTGGRWWVQDAAAAIPARLLRVAPGSRVLDFCAAPGGKTAQLCKAGYAVTAIDDDAGRLERVTQNLARLNYQADIVVADVATYRPAELVDAVLLDAPCSATGTFRRHPEVLWRQDAAGLRNRVALQRRMLSNAAACLNPGGVLIYCVCSLEREEGEDQARWALENLPQLEASPIDSAELPGFPQAVTTAGYVRTHPALSVPEPAEGALDGFFVARFVRRAAT